MHFGVKIARANLGLVVVLSLVEVALTFGFGHPVRQLVHGAWERRFVVGLVVLLESSVVDTFCQMVTTELAVRFWDRFDDLIHAR